MDHRRINDKHQVTVEFVDDSIVFPCTLTRIKDRTTLRKGDIRNVRWANKSFYPATIEKIRSDGLVDVRYLEDGIKYRTSYANIEDPTSLRIGDKRPVRWQDGHYYLAKILTLGDGGDATTNHTVSTKTRDGLDHLPACNLPPSTKEAEDANHPLQKSADLIQADYTAPLIPTKLFHDTTDHFLKPNSTSINAQASIDVNSADSPKRNNGTPHQVLHDSQFTSDIDNEAFTLPSPENHTFENMDYKNGASDSEYLPSSRTNSFSSDSSLDVTTGSVAETSTVAMSTETSNTMFNVASFETSQINSEVDYVNCDNVSSSQSGIVVSPSSNNIKKRIWDKRHCCIFCKKLVTKLPRHFQQMHSEEKEVIEFSNLPLKSEARQKILNQLRSGGNFLHNTCVLERKQGTIIPKRRKMEPTSPSKVTPCPRCNQFFLRKTLYRHKKTCNTSNTLSPTSVLNQRTSATRIAKYMLPLKYGAERYRKIFQDSIIFGMKKCSVLKEIESDPLILKFGLQQVEKFEHQPSQINTIRNRLRELGRLTLEAKKNNPDLENLESLLVVEQFENLLCATKSIAGFKPESNTFEIPSLATKLGESIQKCVAICRKDSIIAKNFERRAEIDDFNTLFDYEWPNKISFKARTTLYQGKFNRGNELPDPSDMCRINMYMEEERKIALENLKTECNASNYKRLAKITLAVITVFNRKRSGDTHKLTIGNYLKGSTGNEHADILKSLSKEEAALVKTFTRIETVGKKGRKVPILLTQIMQEMMDHLLSCREKCGVIKENPYMFAVPGTRNSFYRGSDVIRAIREKADVVHGTRITTTAMRKEAATLSAACGLSEQQVDLLANFMGHTNLVHREHYRLPESTLQKAKVGKFLTDIQKHDITVLEENTAVLTSLSQDSNTEKTSIPPPLKLIKKNKKPKRMWGKEEEEIIKRELATNLVLKKLPGKRECETLIKKYPLLRSRNWFDVKYKIKNLLSKKS